MKCTNCNADPVEHLRQVGAADDQCRFCTDVEAVIWEYLSHEEYSHHGVEHGFAPPSFDIQFNFVEVTGKQLHDTQIAAELRVLLKGILGYLEQVNYELGGDWLEKPPIIFLSESEESRDARLDLTLIEIDEEFGNAYRTAVMSHRRELREARKHNNPDVRSKLMEAADAKLACRVTAAEAAYAASSSVLEHQFNADPQYVTNYNPADG